MPDQVEARELVEECEPTISQQYGANVQKNTLVRVVAHLLERIEKVRGDLADVKAHRDILIVGSRVLKLENNIQERILKDVHSAIGSTAPLWMEAFIYDVKKLVTDKGVAEARVIELEDEHGESKAN